MTREIDRGLKWENYFPESRGQEGQQSLLLHPPQKGRPELPLGQAWHLLKVPRGPREVGVRT